MIGSIGRLARAALPFKPLFVACAAAGFLLFWGALLFTAPATQDRLLVPALLGFLWGLSAWALVLVFADLPDAHRYAGSAPLWQRLRGRLLRAWYTLVALVFAATTVGLLVVSLRLLLLWHRDGGA